MALTPWTSDITQTTARYNWGPPPLWTPAGNIAFWFDPSDPDTVVLESNNIIELLDKSGNSRNVISVGLVPVLQDVGFNGRACMSFDGGYMTSPIFENPTGEAGLLLAMVLERVDDPINYSVPISKGPLNTQWSLVYGRNTVLTQAQGIGRSHWRNATSGGTQFQTALGPTNWLQNGRPYLFSGVISNASIQQFYEGFELSGSLGEYSRTFGDSSILYIGTTSSTSSNLFYGRIGEIIGVYGDVTVQKRQELEGYLAHKWGFIAQLDDSHPHKSAPP
jgi:hypothetical protein